MIRMPSPEIADGGRRSFSGERSKVNHTHRRQTWSTRRQHARRRRESNKHRVKCIEHTQHIGNPASITLRQPTRQANATSSKTQSERQPERHTTQTHNEETKTQRHRDTETQRHRDKQTHTNKQAARQTQQIKRHAIRQATTPQPRQADSQPTNRPTKQASIPASKRASEQTQTKFVSATKPTQTKRATKQPQNTALEGPQGRRGPIIVIIQLLQHRTLLLSICRRLSRRLSSSDAWVPDQGLAKRFRCSWGLWAHPGLVQGCVINMGPPLRGTAHPVTSSLSP